MRLVELFLRKIFYQSFFMQIQNNATFSIVVPLFNEEENIFPLVQKIIEAVGENPRFLEIVLVDDGSGDATADLALSLAEQDERVRLVRHERNRGLGAAIRTGLKSARGDLVLYTDADLPFDFKLIPQLISQSSANSLVSGYRLNRGEGGRRLLLTTVYNFIIRILFGLNLHDVNFACKIFPKRFLQKAEFHSIGSFIDVEILLEARRLGLEIIEHPLVYYPRERGLSTLSRPQVIFFILREMFGYVGRVFSDQTSIYSFINYSPLVKYAVCSATALTSIIIILELDWAFQIEKWLFLTIGAAITAKLLGWRAGLMTAAVAVFASEFYLFRQNQQLLSPTTVYFIICAFLGVGLSRVWFRSRKFVRESLDLNMSE